MAFRATAVVLSAAFACVCAAALSEPTPWQALNSSIQGRLVQGKPFALPCFTKYQGNQVAQDNAACAAVQQSYFDSTSRVKEYGGFMHDQDAVCGSVSGDQCLLDEITMGLVAENATTLPAGSECSQGAISAYAVSIQNETDVQAAYNFSRQYGVPLSIKNTGHDYLARSSLKGSLAVWTHNLQKMQYEPHFQPGGCQNGASFNAVTLGAGVTLDQAYDFANSNNVTFVGGSAVSVGATGGWLLGGGHGVLTRAYGLAVDRVLEFRIVTPDGHLRTVNSCSSPDLFWALRGGGAGAFGVVIEATQRVEPATSLSVVTMTRSLADTNPRPWFEMLVQNADAWAKDGWGGIISGQFTTQASPLVSGGAANKSMSALKQYSQAHNGTFVLETLPNWYAFYEKYVRPAGDLGTGTAQFADSRLVPASMFSGSQEKQLVDFFVNQSAIPQAYLEILAVTPLYSQLGKGQANQTSAPLAWRNSLWHVTTSTSWAWNSTVAQKKDFVTQIKALSKAKQELAPNSATYVCESNPWLEGWQQAYWQGNYPKLLEIKKKYDPSGILGCYRCVGWEEYSQRNPNTCMSNLDT